MESTSSSRGRKIAAGIGIEHLLELGRHQSGHVLHAADQFLRVEVAVERDDTPADMLGMIADPLEVVADAHRAHDLAQIDGHRLPPRDGEDRFVFDFALQGVDRGVGRHHALAERHIAIHQGLDGIVDLPLHQAAHLGDLAHDFLQIAVERLGGVVNPGGLIGHGDYPKRPVM
jgi:hypothetical protein